MSGISYELCVNQGIDVAKSRHIAEAVAGGVMKALGMSADRCKGHIDFNAGTRDRHICPHEMIEEGYWPTTFVGNVDRIIKASPPETQYEKPVGVPWELGETVGWQVLNDLPFYTGRWEGTTLRRAIPRSYASDKAPQSAAAIEKGKTIIVTAQGKTKDGVTWIIDDKGNRIRRSAVSTSVAITQPKGA